MARRVAAVLICICVILGIAGLGQSVSAEDCVLAANDELLWWLSPYYLGGMAYIPCHVFTNYFGIGYTFLDDMQAAHLHTSAAELYFDVVNGMTIDGNGNEYEIMAVYRDGEVYVPALFVCGFFGLSYSYIDSDDISDILRIKSSAAVLSDEDFLSVARAYLSPQPSPTVAPKPSTPPSVVRPTPSPSPSPSPSPTSGIGSENVSRANVTIYLGLNGVPATELLTELARQNMKAAVFLTADELRAEPDLARRLVSEGHVLGVFQETYGEKELDEALCLIEDAAKHKALVVTSEPELEEYVSELAADRSMVYWSWDVFVKDADESVARLDETTGSGSISVGIDLRTCERSLYMLQYLSLRKYTIRAAREFS